MTKSTLVARANSAVVAAARAARPRFRVDLDALEARTFFANVTVNVNPSTTFQTIEGLGAAMIPWSNKTEYRNPAFFDLIANDLGASMARASILPMAEAQNDNNDPNTFNWAGFDHNALAAPFTFFQKLKERGVDKFVGSVWTAPDWMKTNQIFRHGGALRPDEREEFAEYLSAVSQLAKSDFGVDLTALSIQNEPYFVEPYESTTYDAIQLREAVRATMRKFSHDGVSTKILLPEDLIFEDRVGWYVDAVMKDPETKNFNGAFAGHGLSAHWPEIRDTLAKYNKPFWMTETSGNSATWEGALGMANGIMNAIGTANAAVYLHWQFSDTAANAKFALMTDGAPTVKYYAAKQFYRYIRPGMVHIDSSSSINDQLRVASFKDPKTGAMTHVIINRDGEAHNTTFNLGGSGLPGTYKVFRSSSTENMVSLGNITGGSNFTVNIPGLSIVTITNMPEITPKTGTAMPKLTLPSDDDFVSTNGLFSSALKGFEQAVKDKIAAGEDPNQTAPNGWTPLHSAAAGVYNGTNLTVKALLDAGVNPNAKANDGWTPLHAAAANGFTKFGAPEWLVPSKIGLLVDGGANVNAKDNDGRTPLHWAAWVGEYFKFNELTGIVDKLIEKGADPFIKDNFGKTPLDYAKSMGYIKASDRLTKAMGLDKVKPTGDIVDVSPDPRDTSVTDFTINFSERVYNFDLTDITLTLNGTPLELPIGAELTTTDDQHFKLSGFGGHTAVNGTYVISVFGDVTDPSANPLAAVVSDSWSKGGGGSPPPPPPPPPGTPQTPFKGTPFAVNATGTTTIQFEDFDNGGEGVAFHDATSANEGGAAYRTSGVDLQATADAGGGYNVAYTKAGEWLEYTINVAQTGAYDFGFRVATTGANAKFHVDVDGVNATGALTVPNTGNWQTYQTLTKTGVNLTAGQHIVRVALDTVGSNGSIGNLNWFAITKSTGSPPPPPPPPPSTQAPYHGSPFAITNGNTTTIQLEDFDNGGQGIAFSDTTSANQGGVYRTTGVDIQATTDTGGGYNVGYTKNGEWLEYTINVASAGTYNLDFRVAAAAAGGKFHAEIDGVNVTGALTVPNTGGYQTWQTVTKSGVSLGAGDHVLRIFLDATGSNGSAGNFNWLKIGPNNSSPPPPPPPPPPTQTPFGGTAPTIASAGTTTLQVENFDNGGEGIAYHDLDITNNGNAARIDTAVDVELTGDTGGGYHVAYTAAGEWLEYTVNVAQAGTYTLDFRVAHKGLGGKFRLFVDGVDKTGQLQVPDTLAWNSFQSVTKTGVSLTAGQHVLRLAFDTVGTSGFAGNFNSLRITPTSVTPGGTTLTNSTSAYIRGGSSGASNFGSDSTLIVKKHTDASSVRESYLKFDLSSVSTINSAKLRLYGSLNDTSSTSVQTQVFGGASTPAWDEATLTWNIPRPASAGSALSSVTVTGTTKQWYELDVTNFLKAEKAAGRNTVTLILRNPTQSNALVVFNSDDAASNKPQLVLS